MICRLFSAKTIESLQKAIQLYIEETETETIRISINSTSTFADGKSYSLLLWHRLIEKAKTKEEPEQIIERFSVQPGVELSPQQEKVYKALKKWRRTKALSTAGLWAGFIPDKALLQVAYFMPKHIDKLSKIKYIGPDTIEKYGDEIIDVVNE